MRKILSAALAALVLALAAPALPAAAAGTPAYATAVKTLLPSAARTATATGAGVTTSVSTQPVLQFNVALAAGMTVLFNYPTATSGTLDLTIQGSIDNVTFFTLPPLTGTASAAWTQVTTSAGSQVRTFLGPLPPYIRAVGTAATTPSHTYSVYAVFGG